MQILCTLRSLPSLALLPLLGSSQLSPPTSLYVKQRGAILCFPIHFILCLFVLVLRLPCHWNRPCVHLQWPAVTSPSHACDLLPYLALQQPSPTSHPPASFFGLGGMLPALSTLHPLGCPSTASETGSLLLPVPRSPFRHSAPIPCKNVNTHTLATAARSSASSRSWGAAEWPDVRQLHFRLRWLGVLIPADWLTHLWSCPLHVVLVWNRADVGGALW